MSRIQEVNLKDLLFSAGTASVKRGAELLRRRPGRGRFLDSLLRDFRTRPIGQRATRQRDDVDNLLGFYSLLEVACICRFVPNPLPEALRKEARAHLALPQVERFYTTLHPQLLPQAFRRRVAGEGPVVEKDDETLAGDFLFFLSTTREFEADEDIEALLTFLDDYVIDDASWLDVEKIVCSPRRFVKKMMTLQDENDLVGSAIVGYWKFVNFCLSLHDFLNELESRPLMQSAVWHYYAYWFDHVKEKIGGALEKSLRSMQAMLTVSSRTRGRREYATAMKGIEDQRAAFKDLFSTRYQVALAVASTSVADTEIANADIGPRVASVSSRSANRQQRPPTKSEILATISEETELSEKQVAAVFASLSAAIRIGLRRHGLFTIPGLLKMKVVKRPATKSRRGVNPFTGERMMFKAKPASRKVRIAVLKDLKRLKD